MYLKISECNNDITDFESDETRCSQNSTQSFYNAHTQIIRDVADISMNNKKENEFRNSFKKPLQNNKDRYTNNVATQEIDWMQAEPSTSNKTDIHEAPTQVINLVDAETNRVIRGGYSTPNTKMCDDNREEVLEVSEIDNATDIHDMQTQVVDLLQAVSSFNSPNNNSKLASSQSNDRKRGSEISRQANKENETENSKNENIHTAVTQVINWGNINKPNYEDIHEAPTQVINMNNIEQGHERIITQEETDTLRNNSTDNVHETDKMANLQDMQTQECTTVQSDSQGIENNIDTTLLNNSSESNLKNNPENITKGISAANDDENSNGSIDFMLMQKPKTSHQESTSFSINNYELEQNSNEHIDRLGLKADDNRKIDRIKNDSNSDTDVEDSGEKISFKTKKLLDSDSETDIEDNGDKMTCKTKKLLNSDSETDIEDNGDKILCKTKKLLLPLPETQESSEGENINIEDTDSDTDIEDSIIDKRTKSRLSNISDIVIQETQNNSIDPVETLNETDCIPATQEISVCRSKTVASYGANGSSDESFKLGLTEMLEHSDAIGKFSQNQNEKSCISKENENKNRDYDDDSTDIEDNLIDIPESKLHKDPSDEKSSKESGQENEGYLETQDVVVPKKRKVLPLPDSLENNSDEDNNLVTQDVLERRPRKVVRLPSSLTEDSDVDNADIFLQPTQKVTLEKCGLNHQKATKEENTGEEIYFQATQKICEQPVQVPSKPEDEEPEELLKKRRKTIPLNSSCEELDNSDSELYIFPTQKIQHINSRERTTLTETTQKANTAENLNSSVEDNIYLQPTQKCDNEIRVELTQKEYTCIEASDVPKSENEELTCHTASVANTIEAMTDSNHSQSKKFNFKKPKLALDGSLSNILSSNPPQDTLAPITSKETNLQQESQTLSMEITLPEDISNLPSIDEKRPSNPLAQVLEKEQKHFTGTSQNYNTRAETLTQIQKFIQETSNESKESIKESKTGNRQSTRKSTQKTDNRSPSPYSSSGRGRRKLNRTGDAAEPLHITAETDVLQDFQDNKNSPENVSNKKPKEESKESCFQIEPTSLSVINEKVEKVKDNGVKNDIVSVEQTISNLEERITKTDIKKVAESQPHKRSRRIKNLEDDMNKVPESTSEKVFKKPSNISSLEDNLESSMETSRSEMNQTLAILEAKSSKTRKTRSDATSFEIKVSVPKNRRSMTVSMLEKSALNSDIKPITEVSTKQVRSTRRKASTNTTTKEEITSESDKKESVSGRRTRATGNMESEAVPSDSISSVASSSTDEEPSNKRRKVTRGKGKRACTNEDNNESDKETANNNLGEPSTPRKQKLVLNETALLNSAERTKRKLKPKVVFTMLDNPSLESSIRQLGGSIVDSVDKATVLVTEHVKRSQKLLSAVGQGKPICSPKWITDSKKSGEFLDPWDHILEDREAEKKWNFSLKESLRRASISKILSGYTFQIMVNMAADVLKGAIESCGGKALARNPGKGQTDKLFIVSNMDNKNKWTKIIKQNPDIKVIEPEAIFDGVLRQELRFSQHYLS